MSLSDIDPQKSIILRIDEPKEDMKKIISVKSDSIDPNKKFVLILNDYSPDFAIYYNKNDSKDPLIKGSSGSNKNCPSCSCSGSVITRVIIIILLVIILFLSYFLIKKKE